MVGPLCQGSKGCQVSKSYIVEKTLQVTITEDDLVDEEEELTEDLALEIAKDIDNYEWSQVDCAVVGVTND
jgi:translation elongation factor EF-Tu-like GTPase